MLDTLWLCQNSFGKWTFRVDLSSSRRVHIYHVVRSVGLSMSVYIPTPCRTREQTKSSSRHRRSSCASPRWCGRPPYKLWSDPGPRWRHRQSSRAACSTPSNQHGQHGQHGLHGLWGADVFFLILQRIWYWFILHDLSLIQRIWDWMISDLSQTVHFPRCCTVFTCWNRSTAIELTNPTFLSRHYPTRSTHLFIDIRICSCFGIR